jgi:hypothetical protein
MKITVRTYLRGTLVSQSTGEFSRADTEVLAEAHYNAMGAGECDMVEIEFLDEADPFRRFFRIGTNPRDMVMPVRITR